MIEQTFYNKLISINELSVFGDNILPSIPKEMILDTKILSYMRVNTEGMEPMHAGNCGYLFRFEFQIEIYCPDQAEVSQMLDVLITNLHGWRDLPEIQMCKLLSAYSVPIEQGYAGQIVVEIVGPL